MNPLRFEIRWIDAEPDEDLVGPERWTFATFSLRVEGQSIPFEPRTVRTPMSWLAEWIAECWEAIALEVHTPFAVADGERDAAFVPLLHHAEHLWADFTSRGASLGEIAAWQHRHTLGHGTSSAPLPSIVLLPGIDRYGVVIGPRARMMGGAPGDESSITLVWTRRDDMLAMLASVVDDVLHRARRRGGKDAERWAAWLERRWRAAEKRAHDPDCRESYLLSERARERLGVIDKRDAALGVAARQMCLDISLEAQDAAIDSITRSRPTQRRRVEPAVAPRPSDSTLAPHEQGYRLARELRRSLKNDADPLPLIRDLLRDKCGLDVRPVRSRGAYRTAVMDAGSPYLFWAKDDPTMKSVSPARFAFAGALGRYLFERVASMPFGAASGSHSRLYESRRANAFAAELLLPRAALRSEAAGLSLTDICADYGISASAARWQIHNQVGADDWRLRQP